MYKQIAYKGQIIKFNGGNNKVIQVGGEVTNADYEILLSGTANDNYYIGETRKTASLTYNPSTNQLKINGTAVLTQHQDISGKVNKSGDTMTGDLAISHSDESQLKVYNSTNDETAYLYVNSNHNCGIFTNATGSLTIGNSSTLNILALGNKSDLNYYVSNPSGFRSAINAVNKDGDYMTGILSHTQPTIDISTAPSSMQYGKGTNLLDKNNKGVGFYDSCQWTDGTIATRIYAMRAVGNTTYYNGIQLKIASDGTGDVYVDNANKWRVALGLNTRAGSASDGGNAYTADKLTGFSGRSTTQTWGVQIGTVLTSMFDSNNGGWGFRANCPSNNKISSIIDGYYYQNEGNYRCLDTSDGCINKIAGTNVGGYSVYKVDGGGASIIQHTHAGVMGCVATTNSTSADKTTTSRTTIQSWSITTHGQPLLVFVSGVIKTSRYTSHLNVNIGNVDRVRAGTNLTDFTSVSGFGLVQGIAAGTYTVKLDLTSQDTGTTATLRSYSAYSVLVLELP